MAPKEYLCKKCGDMHKQPINSKCLFVDVNSDNDSQIEMLATSQYVATPSAANDLTIQILAEPKSL